MRKKHRLLHLIVGCLFIIIMLLFRTYYRPWVYTNHLFDFYLADTYTNLFGECVVFWGRKINCVMRCFSFKLIGRGSASAKGVHQHSR
ncbi:MAG: hypothetical protein KH019_20850, partial [Phocaeicola dorei]|nr:hypothetical protein [Phocaeicola dorei]